MTAEVTNSQPARPAPDASIYLNHLRHELRTPRERHHRLQ